MVRPVWHIPRNHDGDTSETLQTDVMRFMAILALCLVAIFALVQSLPLRPVEAEPVPSPATASNQPSAAPFPRTETVAAERSPSMPEPESAEPPQAPVVPRPAAARPPVVDTPALERRAARTAASEPPRPMSARRTSPTATTASKPEPDGAVTSRPVVSTAQPQPGSESVTRSQTEVAIRDTAESTQEGLLLRFASDNALLALVAQGQAEVFAWVNNATWQLVSERGLLSFSPAKAPRRFHTMTSETVPTAIARALHAKAPTKKGGAVITWGVTLPTGTARQIERLVGRNASGILVIQANGQVRLESGKGARS